MGPPGGGSSRVGTAARPPQQPPALGAFFPNGRPGPPCRLDSCVWAARAELATSRAGPRRAELQACSARASGSRPESGGEERRRRGTPWRPRCVMGRPGCLHWGAGIKQLPPSKGVHQAGCRGDHSPPGPSSARCTCPTANIPPRPHGSALTSCPAHPQPLPAARAAPGAARPSPPRATPSPAPKQVSGHFGGPAAWRAGALGPGAGPAPWPPSSPRAQPGTLRPLTRPAPPPCCLPAAAALLFHVGSLDEQHPDPAGLPAVRGPRAGGRRCSAGPGLGR